MIMFLKNITLLAQYPIVFQISIKCKSTVRKLCQFFLYISVNNLHRTSSSVFNQIFTCYHMIIFIHPMNFFGLYHLTSVISNQLTEILSHDYTEFMIAVMWLVNITVVVIGVQNAWMSVSHILTLSEYSQGDGGWFVPLYHKVLVLIFRLYFL